MASKLTYQIINASLVKLKPTFNNYLKTSTTAQRAFEIIDSFLFPATILSDGLFSKFDKQKLEKLITDVSGINTSITKIKQDVLELNTEVDSVSSRVDITEQNISNNTTSINTLQQNVSNVVQNIENNTNNIINLNTKLDQNILDVETLEITVNEEKTKVESIEDRLQDGLISHISLTSGYGTFSYESNEIRKSYTITHNLNSYNLTVNIMYMNDDGYWENELTSIHYIDENTIHFNLVEEREVIVHINAVEYFMSYIYESDTEELEFNITHNLKAFSLLHNILVFDKINNMWCNDLVKLCYLNENTCKIKLSTPSKIKICFIRI